jgi:hypothetical protein
MLKKAEEEDKRNSDMWASVRKLVKLPSFQVRTSPTANHATLPNSKLMSTMTLPSPPPIGVLCRCIILMVCHCHEGCPGNVVLLVM